MQVKAKGKLTFKINIA